MTTKWDKAQAWEKDWHGDCINSLNEEMKQLVYAEKMGLVTTPTPKTPYNFDLEGKRIIDIGGGAYSLLLKCVNHEGSLVVDPLMWDYPKWVTERYENAGIEYSGQTGEEINKENLKRIDARTYYHEAWIYNVLQHTKDPKKVIEAALEYAGVVRIFEWVETGTNIGHLHDLNEQDLNNWLGGEGKVENINRNGAVGKCYYGVFKGKHYVTSSH